MRHNIIQREPDNHVFDRILAFHRWIAQRPARVIVVIGHSEFFRRCAVQLGGKHVGKLDNCQVGNTIASNDGFDIQSL